MVHGGIAMWKLEFKRSLTGNYFLYILGVIVFSYILGYFLPVGIDHVKALSLDDYILSTYTVFTQFGFLIFGFVIVLFFNSDYQSKNILFYRKLEMSCLKYFLVKTVVFLTEFLLVILLLNMVVSILFRDFSYYLLQSYLFSAVIFQYVLIVGCISLMVPNVLLAYLSSLIFWIVSIVLAAIQSPLKYIALFDASNKLYQVVANSLQRHLWDNQLLIILPFLVILLVLAILLAKIFEKRWLKLGI